MKFLDLFAGIGGFRLGMEQAGHECVGYVECDPYCATCKKYTQQIPSDKRNHTICTECGKEKKQYARISYEAMHDTEGEWTAHDITRVTDEDIRLLSRKGIDVICGGFPCQAFSTAGNRGGFEDTRGTLFFEIARIAEQVKPRLLLLENVKGLLSHDKGRTFGTILNTLDELGYDCEWQVLNSKNFGVPQNRERVFVVGHLRGSGGREVFPIKGNDETPNIKVIGTIAESVIRSDGSIIMDKSTRGWVHDAAGIIGAISATEYKQPKQILVKEATKKGYAEAAPGDSVNYSIPTSKTRRGRVGQGIANTLDTGCQQGVVTEELRIRKLTPRECWRLQGFPDHAFDKAAEVNSNSQLYKQAGNSVTVNVIHEIAKRL